MGVREYGCHNLVADVLLSHHSSLLRDFLSSSVVSFVEAYKKFNKCGRAPKCHKELYDRRYPASTAAEDKRSGIDAEDGSVDSNAAICAIQVGPPPGTVQKDSVADDSTSRNLFDYNEGGQPQPQANDQTNKVPPTVEKSPEALATETMALTLAKLVAATSKDSPSVNALLKSCPDLMKMSINGKKLLAAERRLKSSKKPAAAKTTTPVKTAPTVKPLSPVQCP
jgi:hypothetical protein